jgi:uncharacterized small protein (DUF1192 family)
MFDEEEGRRRIKPVAHEIGCDLAAISVDELKERIGLLQGEVRRLEEEIARKQASRDAAANVFRF